MKRINGQMTIGWKNKQVNKNIHFFVCTHLSNYLIICLIKKIIFQITYYLFYRIYDYYRSALMIGLIEWRYFYAMIYDNGRTGY